MRYFLSSFFLVLVSIVSTAQVASHGPLYIGGKDRHGFDIFMVVCRRDRCIGPHMQRLGTRDDVLHYLPYIPARAITAYQFRCWKFCFDGQGKLIGRPSPDYRNVYQRP